MEAAPHYTLFSLFIIIIIIVNSGILSLIDSHHNHYRQNPSMVILCHGGNVRIKNSNDGDGGECMVTETLWRQ